MDHISGAHNVDHISWVTSCTESVGVTICEKSGGSQHAPSTPECILNNEIITLLGILQK